MKRIALIIFLSISCIAMGQDISIHTPSDYTSIDVIVNDFKTSHHLQFSYDVKRMQESYIPTLEDSLSFNSFKNRITAINIELEEESTGNYLLIQDDTPISYCIIIKDRESGFEIPDVIATHNSSYIGVTDLSGQLNLTLVPGKLLTLTLTGYVTQRIIVGQKEDCDLLLLNHNTQKLDEIVLTNYPIRGIVKNENSSLTLYPKALGILPGLIEPDIFQSLQLIPGISNPEENPSELHIRGGSPDQNLILWDGIRMYQNSHFFNQITSFNPYITKKVDIYRSGTSVRFGDRISGVIDMHSSDDIFKTFKAGGGINLLSGDAYFKIPISKKLGVLIAGRRSLTDIFETFAFNSLTTKVFQGSRIDLFNSTQNNNETGLNYFFSDINAKLSYKPNDQHTYTLSFISISNQLKNKNLDRFEGNSFEANDKLKQNNSGASFTWRREKENHTTKKFQMYLSYYSSGYDFNSETTNENNEIVEAKRNNKIFEYGHELSYDIPFGKKHSLLLGHQSTITSIDNLSLDLLKKNNNETDAITLFYGGWKLGLIGYAEYRYRTENLFFNAGIRTENSNLIGINTEPRISSSIKINNHLRLTGSLERRNQSFSQINNPQIGPSFSNLIPSVNSFWTFTNIFNPIFSPSKLIQKSNQFTLGALYDKKGWSIELEGYYKKIINTNPLNDTFLTSIYFLENRTQFNAGKSIRFGTDLFVKKRINNYRIWLSYSLSKNSVIHKDIQSKPFPESFDQRHRFNISQTYKYKRYEFALGWTYGSGLPFTNVSNGSRDEIARIRANNLLYNKRLPNYHRLDLSSVYHFKNQGRWNGKFGVSVRNLYNRNRSLNQIYSLFFNENDDAFIIRSTSQRTLSFTPDVVFRISF